MKKLPIKFELGHEFTSADADGYDEIVVATGAKSLHPRIPGIDNTNVLDSWNVLSGEAIPYGKIAVCGGGLVGTETAEYLAQRGYKVSIIEMKEKIAAEESSTILPFMMADFKEHQTELLPLHKILEFTNEGVKTEVIDKDGNKVGEELVKADTIINALSSVKVLPNLDGVAKPIHYVGDCAGERPSNIEHAIKSAYDVASQI